MVAGQDDASGLLDGNPTGSFEGLGGFVDEQGREFLTRQYAVGTACQRAGNDPRFVEQAFVDGDFQFGSPVAQAGYLLVKGFTARRRAVGVQVADGFADGPKRGVRRMCFETPFVGERQHLVIHARRVAHAQHSHTPVGQFLRNPVYGHVALGAYQYLAFAVERLVDGFHKGGGLARSRRAVHDHHVFGTQHFVDGNFLRGVQPRETYRLEGEMSGLRCAVKNVAQFGQAAVPCGAHPVQSFEHQAVGSLVQVELHADAAVFPQMRKGFHVRQDYRHPIAVYETYGAGEVKIMQLAAVSVSS